MLTSKERFQLGLPYNIGNGERVYNNAPWKPNFRKPVLPEAYRQAPVKPGTALIYADTTPDPVVSGARFQQVQLILRFGPSQQI